MIGAKLLEAAVFEKKNHYFMNGIWHRSSDGFTGVTHLCP